MKLEIFDANTRERIDIIRTFEFAQYEDSFLGIGKFSLTVPYTESSLKNLIKENYILFEDGILGIIKKRSRKTSKATSVSITGFLIKQILHYRVFEKSKTYSGQLSVIARSMVSDLMITNADSKRNISFVSLSTDPKYIPTTDIITKQVTGSFLDIALGNMLDERNIASDVIPVISNYNELTSELANISSFEFRVIKPVDRSVGNIEGNTPVVFDVELNNLSSLDYEEDAEDYCTTAFVAGEGEGIDRKVIETGDTTSSGINRIEIYVDARDLQSTDENGTTLTTEEYENTLKQRGNEELEDHKIFESFDGNIIDGPLTYKYGTDFYKGDIVSVIDRQLGLSVSARIKLVTKSLTKTGEKLDITFGYEKLPVKNLLKKKGVI